jgi:hypothetical protein
MRGRTLSLILMVEIELEMIEFGKGLSHGYVSTRSNLK